MHKRIILIILAIIALPCSALATPAGVPDIILKNADTRGQGAPIVVFNPLSWKRTDAVEAATPFPGKNVPVKITDQYGSVCAAKSIGDKIYFTARNVPALGFKVFWVTKAEKPLASGVVVKNTLVENKYFRVFVDPDKGAITKLIDKTNNRSILADGESSSLLSMVQWKKDPASGSMTEKRSELDADTEVVMMDSGPASGRIVFDRSFGKSNFVQEVALYDAVPRLDIRLSAEWSEELTQDFPRKALDVAFRSALNKPEIWNPEFAKFRWGGLLPGIIALKQGYYNAVFCKNEPASFNIKGDDVWIELLAFDSRTRPSADGVYEVTYSIFAQPGAFRPADAIRRAIEMKTPMSAKLVGKQQAGEWGKSKSLFSLSPDSSKIAVFDGAGSDGLLLIRVQDISGLDGSSTLRTAIPNLAAQEIDAANKPIGPELIDISAGIPVDAKEYNARWFVFKPHIHTTPDGKNAPGQ